MIAAIAPAATVTVDFGATGSRKVWQAMQLPTEEPAAATEVTGTSAEIPFDPDTAKMILVWDQNSGDVAVIPVTPTTTQASLKTADFKYAARVRVRLAQEDVPLSAAIVTLDDGEQPRTALVGPGDDGIATFFLVPHGEVKVSASYRSTEGDAKTPVQTFSVEPMQPEADRTLNLAATDARDLSVPAEDPEAGEGTQADRKDPTPYGGLTTPPPATNPWGQAVVYVAALALGGALIFAFLRLLQNNRPAVEEQLGKVGIKVEPEADPDLEDGSNLPAAPIKPAPPEKIILDDATPGPIATPTGRLALVAEDGLNRLDLVDGSFTVGREDGLPLSLPNETTVSRRHAEVMVSGGSIRVRDLGSTNGTFVNGMPLSDEQPLQPGDVIQFGSKRFRVEA